MTANYTKGEWQQDEANKEMICVLAPDEKYGETYKYIAEVNTCRDERFTDAEIEGNARLIASAPDMYEALQLWTSHNQGTRGHYCSECATVIEKAIAKAEGRNV